MALVDLMARLRADPTGFKAGLNSAQRDLNSFQAQTHAASRGVAGAFTRIGAAATSLVGLLAPLGAALSIGSLVNNAKEFESAMGVIQAASGATGRDLALAEQTIREVGIAMGFGARETATAAEELLKAGLAVDDLAAGALRASVVMAAATGGTMAEGANIAVRAMMNFRIEASELNNVVQQAAGVINATTFDLKDYSLALGMSANAAASMGVTFEDFNATLALTASAFSSGSDNGTSFKTFLQRLVPQSEEARRTMERLNFSAFDAAGRFVGMEEVTRRLQASFAGLSQQERARAIITLFGADAQRTANTLINEGAEAFAHMRDVTLQQADANAMAAARWQGVNGAIAALTAQWEELSIAIGQSGLNDFLATIIGSLAKVVGFAREAVRWLNQLNPNNIDESNPNAVRSAYEDAQRVRGEAERDNIVREGEYYRALQSGNDRAIDRAAARWRAAGQSLRQAFQREAELARQLAALENPRAEPAQPELDPELAASIRAAEQYAAAIERAGQVTRDTAETEDRSLTQFLRDASDGIAAYRQAQVDAIGARVDALLGDQTWMERWSDAIDGFAADVVWQLEGQFVNGNFDWASIGETLARGWRQVLWDVFLGDDIRQVMEGVTREFKQALDRMFAGANGNQSSGGFWSGLIGNVFGWLLGGGTANTGDAGKTTKISGNRAGGGPVQGGSLYMVGETGPELFRAPGLAGGNIVSLDAVRAERASGGAVINYSPTIDARGVDAAQVQRLEMQQQALVENLEEIIVATVNNNVRRRKIVG